MMMASPVDLVKQIVVVGSRLSPMFVLAVDPANPTGNVTLQPLEFGVPPAFYHHWTQVSYTKGSSPVVLINDGTQMAAGVATGSGAGTAIGQVPLDHLGGGTKWRVFGSGFGSIPIALQSTFNNLLFIGAQTPDFWGPAAVLEQEWSQIGRNAQWGILPIIPGKSMLALIAMYRSSHDDSLWWSAFDPLSRNWMPDAPIGSGMSASSGPALASLSGQIVAVFRGTDNQLWWSAYNANGRQWQLNEPSLAAYNGDLYCTYKGTGSQHLWWTMFDPTVGTWASSHQFNFDIRSQDAPAVLTAV